MISTNLYKVKAKIAIDSNSHAADAGQNIGYERGAQMVKKFYDKNSGEVAAHFIGRELIEGILSQPGAVGITVLAGVDELGAYKPVLVGVDSRGNFILNITSVNTNGEMKKQQGIVASGVISPGGLGTVGW